MDYLRDKITKISGTKRFCHIQVGNYEFIVAACTNTEKIFEYLKSLRE